MANDAYKRAGVDIDAGNALVQAIKPLAKATDRPGVVGGLGGFGGLFDPRAAGYADPILVAATDGVGTKLRIATEHGRHDTIGIDLVAMCVNDLVAQGAEPLFFLDYFATGRLDPTIAEPVIAGIAEGCRRAGCALLGGETAEMPGHYQGADYDLAGFAVGAAERGALLPRDDVAAGDAVIGLASDGVHSNGYSLVRRICAEAGLDWGDPAPFAAGETLGNALLTPTRVYVRAALGATNAGGVKAIAHITGGGLIENIPRVLPDGLGVELDPTRWEIPPVFRWLAQAGEVPAEEMARTFNCGLGMVLVCETRATDAVLAAVAAAGERAMPVGRVIGAADGPAVRLGDWAARWA